MLERIFRILLVSSSKSFSSGIASALKQESYTIDAVDSIVKAKQIVLAKEYDIIVLNSPLVDDFGLDFAIDESSICGVMMFVKPELESEIYYKTYQYGVLTLTKPTSVGILLQSLRLLTSTISKREQLNSRPNNLKKRLEEIKIINTAKLLLIEHKHISEDEAHRYLEVTAMNFRQSKVKIAQEIIDEYYKKT